MSVIARLDQYSSIVAYEFDETTANNLSITGLGTYYAFEFNENVGIATTLTTNIFPAYSPDHDEFGGTLFGPAGGSYMRQNTDKSVGIYNEIDEITPIVTDISTTGLQLYIDAGVSTSFTQTAGVGQSAFTTPGTYTFTVPLGTTSISAVAVGGGGGGGGGDGGRGETNSGGGGGGLSYATSIAVTPGETLTVVVGSGGNSGAGNNGGTGGTTTLSRGATTLLSGGGGTGGSNRNNGNGTGGASGGTARTGGGSGGNGGTGSNNSGGTGGGGAGGYSGNGGAGGAFGSTGSAGAGGGGGGGGGFSGTTSNTAGGGGGVEILGSGGNGTAGTTNGGGGGGGSSGTNGGGNTSGLGGTYGGGGGGAADNNRAGGAGTGGAVRIIWGTGRSYPSTNVADATPIEAFTLNDLSGNGRTASSVNGPTYTSLIRGGAIVYDGADDYMTNTSYKGITGTTARTTIIWFKASVPNVAYRLFGWGTTAAGGKWNISTDATTFRPRVEIGTASVLANTSAPNVTNGKWYMIAASAPASGTANNIRLYINGNLITDTTITSGATAINTVSGSDVSFGASLADVSPEYLNGNVSQFLIYNRQLTDLEIMQIYRIFVYRL